MDWSQKLARSNKRLNFHLLGSLPKSLSHLGWYVFIFLPVFQISTTLQFPVVILKIKKHKKYIRKTLQQSLSNYSVGVDCRIIVYVPMVGWWKSSAHPVLSLFGEVSHIQHPGVDMLTLSVDSRTLRPLVSSLDEYHILRVNTSSNYTPAIYTPAPYS